MKYISYLYNCQEYFIYNKYVINIDELGIMFILNRGEL
jgi:hypothetical protein